MIKKIKVTDLDIGMFIEDINAPWIDHPFLANSRLIKSAQDIQRLLGYNIDEVFINTEKGRDSSRAINAQESRRMLAEELRAKVLQVKQEEPGEPDELKIKQQPPGAGRLVPLREELRAARTVYSEAKVLVKDLLQEARVGNTINGESARKAVDLMIDSIFRNPDALLSLSRLKNFDDYTFQHSLNVAVLCISLGRSLGLVQDELRKLGIGAILHDVGKMRIPQAILNKPGRLTDEESALMRTHTLQGARLLIDTTGVHSDSSTVPLYHHERFNGSGYPMGLEGMKIGKFGLIAAIVDVYDALTSDRIYHEGLPSHLAIQKIYEWSSGFYPIYVQKFIQCLGIFPVGTVVKLDTSEVGVVCANNPSDLLRPWVRVIRSSGGDKMSPRDVDLRVKESNDDKRYVRTVSNVLNAARAGIDVESALGNEYGAAM